MIAPATLVSRQLPLGQLSPPGADGDTNDTRECCGRFALLGSVGVAGVGGCAAKRTGFGAIRRLCASMRESTRPMAFCAPPRRADDASSCTWLLTSRQSEAVVGVCKLGVTGTGLYGKEKRRIRAHTHCASRSSFTAHNDGAEHKFLHEHIRNTPGNEPGGECAAARRKIGVAAARATMPGRRWEPMGTSKSARHGEKKFTTSTTSPDKPTYQNVELDEHYTPIYKYFCCRSISDEKAASRGVVKKFSARPFCRRKTGDLDTR